ncbi:MAG: hypothetical protein ACXWQO_00280 [Bdellovibrionota bacterium]
MKLHVLCLTVISVITFSAEAGAAGGNHPRRTEVLNRDSRLQNRTDRAAKNGKINQDQANKLEGEEGAIKKEEEADAAANGGHITKKQQRHLNREENRVGHELRQDKRQDRRAKKGEAPATATTAPATN